LYKLEDVETSLKISQILILTQKRKELKSTNKLIVNIISIPNSKRFYCCNVSLLVLARVIENHIKLILQQFAKRRRKNVLDVRKLSKLQDSPPYSRFIFILKVHISIISDRAC